MWVCVCNELFVLALFYRYSPSGWSACVCVPAFMHNFLMDATAVARAANDDWQWPWIGKLVWELIVRTKTLHMVWYVRHSRFRDYMCHFSRSLRIQSYEKSFLFTSFSIVWCQFSWVVHVLTVCLNHLTWLRFNQSFQTYQGHDQIKDVGPLWTIYWTWIPQGIRYCSSSAIQMCWHNNRCCLSIEELYQFTTLVYSLTSA